MNYISSLSHHGIKGQKWGIRRFQNEDGTLTEKGKKRLAKNEAYRDKLANRAKKRAKWHKMYAKEAKDNVKDLTENGSKSQVYRDWKDEKDFQREFDYDIRDEERYRGINRSPYEKAITRSLDRLSDDIWDSINADTQVKKLIDQNNKNSASWIKSAKRWTKSNKNLMKMDITALTSRRDIRKVYRSR